MAIFCLTLETRRKRHLSLILHRAPNLPSPLTCLVKRLIIKILNDIIYLNLPSGKNNFNHKSGREVSSQSKMVTIETLVNYVE